MMPAAIGLLPSAFCQKKTKTSQAVVHNYAKYVNPFIGTGGHGHTFPGSTMPFGACQTGPDTRLEGWDGCSGYHYSDSVIYGFSHTHLSGTGCSDYGDILLMPVTKEMALDKYQYASHFSHAREKAQAGYYQVYLEDPKVNAELTSTLHGGIHKYMYGWGSEMYVVLDLKHRDEVLDSKMEKVDDYTIRGYRFSKAWATNQKVFYEIKFSKPIEGIVYEPVVKGTNTTAIHLEKSLHTIIKFAGNPKNQSTTEPKLMVKVSISGVDEEGAHKNMEAEMPHWDFEMYKTKAVAEWEKELSKVKVSRPESGVTSGNQAGKKAEADKLAIFYTALYHCMIHPSIYNDVDGRYRGRDDKIHNTEGKFNYYTIFSLWDTYRGLHPLLTILDKKRTSDFINTFIKQYEQGGRLPIWELSSNETNCMIGYHVVSVIWDAYNKGVRGFDAEKAYGAMTSIATHFSDYEGEGLDMKLKESARKGAADADALESYCKYGYVRSDDSHESVSKTLEYAYDDWCIAQMANELGKKKDYEYYMQRAQNWKNVYDPTTGFMRARKNGCLYEPFSPYTVDNNFTEANSWQYSYYVPHDIGEMKSLEREGDYLKKLDALFSAKEKTEGREQADITGLIGQYAHGNEPSHEIVFLYNYAFQYGKTKSLIKTIVNDFYKNEPDGLIGNEDCGQMSAWYVLNAMGFYPVCPGKNFYDAGTMLFDRIDINNGSQQKVLLKSEVESFIAENPDVKYMHQLYNFLNVVQNQPGVEDDNINKVQFDLNIPVNPYIENCKRIFAEKQAIAIACLDKGCRLFFSVNNGPFKPYLKPIEITENTSLQFYSQKGDLKSPVQTASFTKLPADRKIILHNQYNPSYSAGGGDALMDGIYGKLNWRAGDWQGYQGQDVEVIMAFDKPKEIKKIAANFLEDQNSWIFYPKEVVFYVSDDSVQWTMVEAVPTNKPDHAESTSISKFQVSGGQHLRSRFVKMLARNFGPMPQWHEGRGNPTFIFLDEFIVE